MFSSIILKQNYVFTATQDRAIYFRNLFHAKPPIRNCNRRRSDESTPPLSPPQTNRFELNAVDPNATRSSSLLPTQNDIPSGSNHNDLDIDLNADVNSRVATTSSHNASAYQNVFEEIDEFQSDQSEQSSNQEVKNVMPEVHIPPEDSDAIDAMFDSDSNSDGGGYDANSDIQTGAVASNETTFYEDGVLKVRTKYDEDCEYVIVYGTNPQPKIPEYQVKLNDIISGNIPFKENVSMFF